MIKVLHYIGLDGTDYFDAWLNDQTREGRSRIQTRIDRVEDGNLGDHKTVGGGVSELRINFGPGYRVYFGRHGQTIVVLLAGGTKKRQARDIATAQKRWSQYKQEKRDARKRT